MKTMTWILTVLLTAVFSSACDKKSDILCETVSFNKPFLAKPGDVKCIPEAGPNDGFSIRFGPMLEDSRCNVNGVDCIWAGRFVMETTLAFGDVIMTDTFDARAVTEEVWSDTLIFEDLKIILAKVNPGVRDDFSIDTSEYTLDMLIKN